MGHARDDETVNIVENELEWFGSVWSGMGQPGPDMTRLDLAENWVGLDFGVVIGYEVDHLVGLFAKFFWV